MIDTKGYIREQGRQAATFVPEVRIPAAPAPERWTLARVRLNQGGYDSAGQYFGIGAPLYRYSAPDGRTGEVRAWHRQEAKDAVRDTHAARYPAGIEFYR